MEYLFGHYFIFCLLIGYSYTLAPTTIVLLSNGSFPNGIVKSPYNAVTTTRHVTFGYLIQQCTSQEPKTVTITGSPTHTIYPSITVTYEPESVKNTNKSIPFFNTITQTCPLAPLPAEIAAVSTITIQPTPSGGTITSSLSQLSYYTLSVPFITHFDYNNVPTQPEVVTISHYIRLN